MKSFNDLVLAHKGKTICIMGGADSLAEDLKNIKADIYISTNAHGTIIQAPDYVFCMDEINSKTQEPMDAFIRARTDAPIISKRGFADYQLANYPQEPRDVLSGMIAAWVAYVMGAKLVILAGMDAYDGEPGYVDEAVKIARDIHTGVRVMSDSLAKVWPKYDKAEKLKPFKPHASLITFGTTSDGEITVEVMKPTTYRGREVKKGETFKTMRHEAVRMLKHKIFKEV